MQVMNNEGLQTKLLDDIVQTFHRYRRNCQGKQKNAKIMNMFFD